MAKTKVSEFDAVASNNTDINSVNVAEGCPPSGINNAIREMASLLKKQEVGTDAMTSPDINGGTIDGATIGGSSGVTIGVSDGTVSAPSIKFTSDANTGIYRGGTDILKFVTAGTDAITIDASQLVGIGTSPSTKLHVYQATGNTALRVESAGTNSQASINFKNDARRYDVGINTSDVFFISDDTSNATRMAIQTNGDFQLYEDTGITPKLFWDASQQSLGVNTSSPTAGYMLHVGGSSGVHTKVKIEATTATGQAELDLSADPAGVSYLNLGDEDSYNIGYLAYFHSDNSMRFQTNSAERMRIDSYGNVGIGSSSTDALESRISNGYRSLRLNNFNINAGEGAYGLIGQNIYQDSAGFYKFIDTGDSSSIHFWGDAMQFHMANGSADATQSSSEKMRLDSSGNLAIGTTSAYFSRGNGIHLADSYYIGFGTGNGTRPDFQIGFNESDNTLNFACGFGADTTDIAINTAGAMAVGSTDHSPYVGTEGFVVALNDATRYGAIFGCDNIANREAVVFVNPNGAVGSIRTNGSSTSFNTSSDHRLKENVSYDFDATTRLKQLKPARFNFIADADTTVDGFLAHEVQSVVPEAISGTHNEVDDDGNPVYQGIDQSKLVPLLVKTIQELEARIVALETA